MHDEKSLKEAGYDDVAVVSNTHLIYTRKLQITYKVDLIQIKKLKKLCHALVRGRDISFVNSIFIKRSPIVISRFLIFCLNKFTNLKLLVILLLVSLFTI